jgi:outer membrane protein TolC
LAPQARAQAAAAAGTRAREDKTRRQVEDAIFDAWQRVATSIDKSRSARSQVQSSASAAELARVRYVGGVATQLDVLQAQQDAFSADIARIQADADLAYARAELRLAAGRPLGRESAR